MPEPLLKRRHSAWTCKPRSSLYIITTLQDRHCLAWRRGRARCQPGRWRGPGVRPSACCRPRAGVGCWTLVSVPTNSLQRRAPLRRGWPCTARMPAGGTQCGRQRATSRQAGRTRCRTSRDLGLVAGLTACQGLLVSGTTCHSFPRLFGILTWLCKGARSIDRVRRRT